MTQPLPDSLRERAGRAGIATEFTSFWGESTAVEPAVIARALAAMGEQADAQALPPAFIAAPGSAASVPLPADGPWRLLDTQASQDIQHAKGSGAVADLPADLPMGSYRLLQGGHEQLVLIAPPRCWLPPEWSEGERWWGITCQLYALRSARNWGIGDFGDLHALVAIAAEQGASFVGLSPLHALHPGRPELASPYSPSSRLALNTLFIDVPAVPEFLGCAAAQALHADVAFQQRLQALRSSEQVQYAQVAAAKQEVLGLLWQHFCQLEGQGSTARSRQFDRFARQHQDTLGRHALFEAIQLYLHASDPRSGAGRPGRRSCRTRTAKPARASPASMRTRCAGGCGCSGSRTSSSSAPAAARARRWRWGCTATWRWAPARAARKPGARAACMRAACTSARRPTR